MDDPWLIGLLVFAILLLVAFLIYRRVRGRFKAPGGFEFDIEASNEPSSETPAPPPAAQTPTASTGDIHAGRDAIVAPGGHVQTGGDAYHAEGDITQTGRDAYHADRDINIHQHAAEQAQAAAGLHQIPDPPGDFTGREDDLREARKAFGEGGICISCLHGMGGVGKTALALRLAHEIEADYPDAGILVDMRGTHDCPTTPAQAMQRVLQPFHPGAKLPDDLADLAPLYTSTLQGKQAVILLDNAADADQVQPLVPPESCFLMVTSRNRFALPGMRSQHLDLMGEEDAVDLVRRICDRITQEEADEIARLCGYLPLALRAAASLLAVTDDLAAGDYIEQLSDERTRLEAIGTEGVPIGVAASFNLSYQRLDEEGQRVFCRLAAFPATFDAAAEEVVCEDEDHRALSDLVRRNMVAYDDETDRYGLHDLVRDFARTRLGDEEREAAARRHAEHYRRVLALADDLFLKGGEDCVRGLGLFDAERANVEAGQAWAARRAEEDDAAARLTNDYPDAGAYVLSLRLHPRVWIEWLQSALAAARRLDHREAEGVHLGNLGIAYADLGETRKAIECHKQYLEIAREIGDRRGEGAALGNVGLAYADLGETRKAIEYHKQYLEIAREIGDRRGEGNALGNLGLAYADLGETQKAVEYYERQLEIAR